MNDLAQELKPLNNAARKRRRSFTKRLWTLHGATMKELSGETDSGRIGELRRLEAVVSGLIDRSVGSDADVLAAMEDARVAGLA